MEDDKPVWKITPPHDSGKPFHIWQEGDGTWQEAHADWDAAPAQPGKPMRIPADAYTPDERIAIEQALIAVTARLALPALTEIVRTYGFPQFVDMQSVIDLVRVLNEANEVATLRTGQAPATGNEPDAG